MAYTSTTTAVEWQTGPAIELESRAPKVSVIAPTSDVDAIMQASAQADAEVPDGGTGWVVITGCAVMTWWMIGTSYCWGVFQAALVKDGLASASTLAFVGSLATACISFLGIPNAQLIRKLGTQTSALMGVFCLGLGSILSGFSCHNIAGLFITQGVVFGVGISLCFMVVSTIPAQYFKAKRGMANGIVYAAGGLGGTALSFLINTLLNSVGTAWTFRIMGFMTLATGLPAAWLVQQRIPIPRAAFVEWRLFRDLRFCLLFAVGAIATFPLLVPPFFLPLYVNSLGMGSTAGAGVVAAFNFSSALGRLTCGFASDTIGPLNTLFGSLLLSALSMLIIWPVSTSIGPLIVFVIINGMSNGGFFSTIPTVVGNVFGSARGSPIAGYILDASGGEGAGTQAYRPAILYAGFMALAATVLSVGIRVKTSAKLGKRV
ncbi:MFS general substrate transporter [Aspergillus saccharolyticus JOP 1030-1]|uniref:MFS general substrate transporter n=1 Tax=Aspergillus saccharolyticus JOP 1030-1 TaxID=1450539 RepID=A0A319A635_9EURO|nr:MFS general substrate transporter [Aspergillus saccharolyticus JOP 1030-1]PYH42852.1 MFS general substrate transporter [Aspergillus saccharolyticus JOP 1030-1]